MIPLSEKTRTFADNLMFARRSGATNVVADGPATLAEAMACQRAVADGLGRTAAGWKVALMPDWGGVYAPMFSGDVLNGPARWPLRPGLAVEVELGIELATDIASGEWAADSLEKCVKRAFVGIELVQSRLELGGQAPFSCHLGDCMANVAYIAGAATGPWPRFDINTAACRVTLGDSVLYDALSVHTMGGPMATLQAALRAGGDAFGGFKAGQIITTGSICGVLKIPHAGIVTASIAGLGSVSVELA